MSVEEQQGDVGKSQEISAGENQIENPDDTIPVVTYAEIKLVEQVPREHLQMVKDAEDLHTISAAIHHMGGEYEDHLKQLLISDDIESYRLNTKCTQKMGNTSELKPVEFEIENPGDLARD